jgi:hypothetical protein
MIDLTGHFNDSLLLTDADTKGSIIPLNQARYRLVQRSNKMRINSYFPIQIRVFTTAFLSLLATCITMMQPHPPFDGMQDETSRAVFLEDLKGNLHGLIPVFKSSSLR